MKHSNNYRAKKESFDNMLTLYGRKPVLEALRNQQIQIYRLHVAKESTASPSMKDILNLAEERHVEVRRHTRKELSRISGNTRQDQGVAIDVMPPRYQSLHDLPIDSANMELMALERITNPQNLGMIIRSITASPLSGIILPRTGCARLDGLVIKASAGTLFQCPIYHCEDLISGLDYLEDTGIEIIGLSSRGTWDIMETGGPGRRVVLLGNETDGLTESAQARCHRMARISLQNEVESLNVSAAAAIIAFRSLFHHR
ncbi:MAG: RNA methyltransferase [Pseudomonadales bacterium]